MILTFGLHFGLGYFGIKCRNRGVQNGGQTSRSSKFFNEIQKFISKLKEFHPEPLKKFTGTLPKVDLYFDNFELWMTVMLAVESADQI